MDSDDDYFDDTLVLDDKALASIQATEQRFVTSMTQVQPPRPTSTIARRSPEFRNGPPLQKKLKISHDIYGSNAPSFAQPSSRRPALHQMDTADFDFDIRCGPDGNYIMGTPATTNTTSNASIMSAFAPSTSTAIPRRPLVRRATATPITEEINSPNASQKRTMLIERALAETSHDYKRSKSVIPQENVAVPKPAVVPSDIQEEMAALRAQLAELGAANANIQKALQEAQDAQLVKGGEVAILRQTIEKSKKEHAETLAKARADMLAHEKIKAELQAKLKEETERLATRLVFKQHELETSSRKPTWGSVRARRIRDMPPPSSMAETPSRVLASQITSSSKRKLHQFYPAKGKAPEVRAEDMEAQLSSPTGDRRSRVRGDNANLKNPSFKGFHNAFDDSRAVMPSPTRKKGRIDSDSHRNSDPFYGPSQADETGDIVMQTPRVDKGKAREIYTDIAENVDSHERSPDKAAMDVDVNNGGISEFQEANRMEEEEEFFEGIDWREELRRLVFSHITPSQEVLTLHMLFSTDLPPETTPEEKKAYITACRLILELCGTKLDHFPDNGTLLPEDEVVMMVSNAFVTMSALLAKHSCLQSLSATLDLLTVLTLHFPAFAETWVATPAYGSNIPSYPNGPSSLLPVLSDIVRSHVQLPKVDSDANSEELRRRLATRVLHLLQAICWHVNDVSIRSLSEICRPNVMDVLLDPNQFPELTIDTLQFLLFLASNDGTFQFLVYPESINAEQGHGEPMLLSDDCSRMPLIDKLCHFLVSDSGDRSYEIRQLVLTILELLCESNSESKAILLESSSLAPSIVVCITQSTQAIWEEELPVPTGKSADIAFRTIEQLYMGVKLLHKIVFQLGLAPMLSRKLVDAARLPGPFNGLTHMFIVTFGRLSWAQAPDELPDDCKALCNNLVDLAMEIIETVVAGPECDSLWAVWHEHEIVDDEEDEARKIEID
ncbi:hypothetical protein M422DRAFT_44310 [Sphaerobolus stellatus SS14]|nr:hypothetical protein M422DRAFT_44310 [Sphaerobolus stellatus SS14]